MKMNFFILNTFCCILILLALKCQQVDSVVAISSYVQNYIINGQVRSNNTLLVTASNLDPSGTFQIGDSTANITGVPPVIVYKYQETGRVPASIVLVENRICLVVDPSAYTASAQQAASQQFLPNNTFQTSSTSAQLFRSGQQTDPLATVLAGTALVLSVYATAQSALNTKSINNLNDRYNNIVGTQLPGINASLNALVNVVKGQQTQINATNDKINALNLTTQILQNYTNQNNQAIQATNLYIGNLTNQTSAGFTTIQNSLNAVQNNVNSAISNFSQQTKDSLLGLSYVQGNSTVLIQSEIQGLVNQNVYTSNVLTSLLRLATETVKESQQQRQSTLAFYSSAATLPSGILPFTLGQGIRPVGLLSGADKRILVEQFNINWVTAVNTAGSYTIINSQVRFYIDSLWAVDNIGYSSTIDQWIVAFQSNGNCNRAFTDFDDVQEGNSTNPCLAWVEVRTYFCTSNKSPQFQWNFNNSQSINSSNCLSNPNLDSRYNGPHVLKSFDQFTLQQQTDYCNQNNFTVTTTRTGYSFAYTPTLSQCQLSWKQQRAAAEGSNLIPTLPYSIFSFFVVAARFSYPDVANRELKLFGRNPGGLQYITVPNDYVPSNYSGITPVYDALAQPVKCVYQNWVAISPNTVPMVSITPSAAIPIQKSIIVSISSPTCTDPTKCYQVTQSDITQNVALDISAVATLPSAFLALGFMNDFSQGIWDVPQRSISGSVITAERENTVGYIMMPPGTTTSFTLPQWIGRNNAQFNPIAASVSANYYKFTALFDSGNSPYCSVVGGQPVGTYQTTTYGCVQPYSGVVDGTQTSLKAGLDPLCTGKQSAIMLLEDYQTQMNQQVYNQYSSSGASNQVPSVIAGSQNYTLSFHYQHDQVLGNFQPVILYRVQSQTANNFIQFGVNANGQPSVQMTNFDSSSTINPNVNIKDGNWHQIVFVVSVKSNLYTFTIYIDGINTMTISNAVSNFGSQTDLIVLQLYQQSAIASDAQVRYLNVYPPNAVRTSNQVQLLWQCSQLDSASVQCTTAVYSSLLAFNNITTTNGVNCAPFQYLQRSYAFDQIKPLNIDTSQKNAGVQSVSFWVKGGNVQLPINSLLLSAQIGNMAFNLTYSGSSVLSLNINDKTLTYNIWDTLSHRFNIEFFLGTNQYLVAVDQNTAQLLTPTVVTTNGNVFFNAPNNHIFMAKWYPNTDMTTSTISNEIQCLVPNSISSYQFVAPVALCKTQTTNPNYAYCRQSLSCVGHCENYAVYDSTTRTYSNLVNQCDPSYAVPDCINRCSRSNAISGQCVDVIITQAAGLTPDSTMCQILANYKIAVNPSQQIIQLIPRIWMYTASISIPSGVVTQVINTGGCPQSTISGNADGTYTVNFVNSGSNPSYVVVTYAPDGVFNGTVPCVSGCCLLSTDQIIQVPANSVNSVVLPGDSCGLLTVIVSLSQLVQNPYSNITASQLTTCTTFNSLQVSQQIAITSNQPVSSAVIQTISVVTDQLSTQTKLIVQAALTSQIQLLALANQIGINNTTFLDSLGIAQAQINNISYNPSNVSLVNNPFDANGLNQQGAAILAANAAAAAAANVALTAAAAQFNAADANYKASNNYTMVAIAAAIQAIDKNSQNLQDLLNKGRLDPVAAANLFDTLKGFAQGVVDAGKTVLDNGLGLLGLGGGGVLGFLGGILKTAVNVGVIAAIVYVGIKLLPAFTSAGSKAASSIQSTLANRNSNGSNYTQLKSIKTKLSDNEGVPTGSSFSRRNLANHNRMKRTFEDDY